MMTLTGSAQRGPSIPDELPWQGVVAAFSNGTLPDSPGDAVQKETSAIVETGLSVVIRRARLRDVSAASHLPYRLAFNYPDTPLRTDDLVASIRKAVVPIVGNSRPTFIARHARSSEFIGLVQFHRGGPDGRWVLESASLRDDNRAPSLLTAILEHSIREAGVTGVRRLYAKVSDGGPGREALHAAGFSPYSVETVLRAGEVPLADPDAHVVRLEQADVWAVHQLYVRTTPHDVQFADALTSHAWDIDRNSGKKGWCLLRNYDVAASAIVTSRRDAHVVDFMAMPDAIDLLPGLFATVFAELRQWQHRAVFVTVRAWQQETIRVLEQFGLERELEQELLVRYTTAQVKAHPARNFSLGRERVPERATGRVPSFCTRRCHDDAGAST